MPEKFGDNQSSEQLYNQYDAMRQIEESNKKKYEAFKSRIKAFENIETLEEAKSLAVKILPVKSGVTHFRVGNVKCTVINNDEMFRLSMDTPTEFISYNFE